MKGALNGGLISQSANQMLKPKKIKAKDIKTVVIGGRQFKIKPSKGLANFQIPKDVLADLVEAKNKIHKSMGTKPNRVSARAGTLRALGLTLDKGIQDDDMVEGDLS